MIATSAMLADGGRRARRRRLGDDVEAGLDQQPGDPLPKEERVVGQDEAKGPAPFTRARIAAPDSSSLGMKPRAWPVSRRGP
jgi:hypothetical protein